MLLSNRLNISRKNRAMSKPIHQAIRLRIDTLVKLLMANCLVAPYRVIENNNKSHFSL